MDDRAKFDFTSFEHSGSTKIVSDVSLKLPKYLEADTILFQLWYSVLFSDSWFVSRNNFIYF